MGDPISAAGTAVGVLSLGIQVCSGIFKYYEAWRDYDNDIQFIRAGVEQLSHGFTLVRDTMSSENIKHQPGAQQIEATVLNCEDGIRALSRRLDKVAATKPMRALPAPGSGDGAAVVWLEDARRHLLYPFRRGTILKLRDEISRLRETLEPALTLINIAIAGDTVGELSAFRIEQNKWRQEEENRRILDWLSPLDFQARQKSLVSKVQPGSIKDFFAMPDFVNWIQAATDVPPGLWCHGDMGSGKSVTCAAVAEHLSNSVGHDRNVSVLAIYCNWQDTQVQTVDALIGSLVKQCVEALADIPHHIKSLYAEHRFGKLPLKAPLSLKALLELAASLRQIYIVVDGIDELAYEHTNGEPVHSRMASTEGALDSILSNPAPASANIRIFSTSRFLPQNVSLSLWTTIRFSVPELHLRAYITRALEENDWASPWESQSLAVRVRQDTELMREIADCCVKRANGLYFLLKLTVTHLKRQLNMRQLRMALANLPHTFDEVMKTCVHRVLNQSPARRNLAARTILWISHAYRPMTIQEIQEALSIEIEDDETSPEGWYDIQVIVSSCGGLVTIDEATQTLRFVSFGVQQHLRSNDSVFPEDPHWVILETCFSFFQFRDFAECSNDAWAQYRDVNDSTLETWRETKTQALLVEHPFLAYAARHWHLHQHTAMHPDKAQITAKLLSDYDKAGFLYMMYYTTQFQSSGAMTTRITGLHLSCLLGLSSATELLMSPVEEQRDERSNEPTDSFGRTPLWLAAACGHLDTVTLLLENGHDPSGRGSGPAYGYSCFRWWHPAWARDEYYSQAVEVAAEGGFTDIVHKLITGGAKLDYYESTYYYEKVPGIYGGALEAAVFNNYEETVDVILASNQKVRSSTIQAAVYGGNVSIMTKLLDVRLNQSGWDRYDPLSSQTTLPLQKLLSNALYAAALAGRLNIAQVLLSRGADVNARTFGFHCTALAAASAYGRLDMVNLLLEKGAQVNAPLCIDMQFRTHLNDSIFKDEHSRRAYRHGSALQAASFAGYLEVVRLLCDAGADLDYSEGRFGPAVQAAAAAGELDIVQILVDRGAKLNTVAGSYGTCLQAAAFHRHIEILRVLIQCGADVNLGGGSFGYPIIAAAAGRNVEVLQLLINARASVDSSTDCIGPALTAAISKDDANIHLKSPLVPASLKRASLVSVPLKPNMSGQLEDFAQLTENPMSFFSRQRNPERDFRIFGEYVDIVSREIFVGSDKYAASSTKKEAQDAPSDSQKSRVTACVSTLLAHGADPNNCNEMGTSPLQAAVRSHSLSVANALIAAGADIPATIAMFETLAPQERSHPVANTYDNPKPVQPCLTLEKAGEVQSDRLALCRFFLDRGADVNATRPLDGLTPMHICMDAETITLLLERGAAVDKMSEKGERRSRSVDYSKFQIRPGILSGAISPKSLMGQLLAKSDSDTDFQRETPLSHAVRNRHYEKVDLLLKAGADVNCLSSDGTAPLHCAAGYHSVTMARTLLQAGAQVNLKTGRNETTPLHFAVLKGPLLEETGVRETVLLLLESGADVTARNNCGETPLDVTDPSDVALIMTLLKAGIDPREQEVTFINAVSFRKRHPRLGNLEVAQWLIDRGYDINSGEDEHLDIQKAGPVATPRRRCNALLSLAANGPNNPERLAFLLRNGIDLKRHGQKALRLAIENKNLIIARGLKRCRSNLIQSEGTK